MKYQSRRRARFCAANSATAADPNRLHSFVRRHRCWGGGLCAALLLLASACSSSGVIQTESADRDLGATMMPVATTAAVETTPAPVISASPVATPTAIPLPEPVPTTAEPEASSTVEAAATVASVATATSEVTPPVDPAAPQPTDPPVSGSQTVLAANGAEVYTLNCARCHAENGMGTSQYRATLIFVGRLYSSQGMIAELTDGHRVTFGFAGKLSAEEIASVVAYVKSAFP
jgi:mono/diheme cytochrome c family protein